MAKIYRTCSYCNRRYDTSQSHKCEEQRLHENRVKADYQRKMKEVDAPLRTKRWRALRKRIILADNAVCQRCLIKFGIFNYENLEVHHIKPRINYPNLIFDETNLVTLCHSCNAQLALNKLDFEFDVSKRTVDHDYHL